MSISTYVHPTITKTDTEKFLKKKGKVFTKIELIYLPFRIYTFHITLKRWFLKPKKIQLHLLLNGIDGQFSLINLDFNELTNGVPKSRKQPFRLDVGEYDHKSKEEVLFHLMKRYFLIFEPLISLQNVVDAYYPFWKYSIKEAVNGRILIIEKLEYKH